MATLSMVDMSVLTRHHILLAFTNAGLCIWFFTYTYIYCCNLHIGCVMLHSHFGTDSIMQHLSLFVCDWFMVDVMRACFSVLACFSEVPTLFGLQSLDSDWCWKVSNYHCILHPILPFDIFLSCQAFCRWSDLVGCTCLEKLSVGWSGVNMRGGAWPNPSLLLLF